MSIRLESTLAARILDAAAVLIARHGIRKTTMEDVAREASCSRAGLYNHFASKDALLASLFLREVEVFLAELRLRTSRDTGPRHLEDAFIFATQYVRQHPVARGVIETDRDIFTSMFAQAEKGLGATAVDVTASLVRVLMARGDIRKMDARLIAELLLRLLVSFLLVPRLTGGKDDEASMRRLFREVVMKGIAQR